MARKYLMSAIKYCNKHLDDGEAYCRSASASLPMIRERVSASLTSSPPGAGMKFFCRKVNLTESPTLLSRMNLSPSRTTGITSLIRGGRVFMRIVVVATAVSLSVVGLSAAQSTAASIRKPVNIQAQGLETALRLFSKESGLHVVYVSEDVTPRNTKGASGALTQDEALTQILGGTGLTYRYLDDDTVTIMPTPSSGASLSSGQGGTTSDQHEQGGQKKPLWDGFRLAQADQTGNSGNTLPRSSAVSRRRPPSIRGRARPDTS
jgi:hypothetical protein